MEMFLAYQRFLMTSAINTTEFYLGLNPWLVSKPKPVRTDNVIKLPTLEERAQKREEKRKLIEVALAVGIYGKERAREYILGKPKQTSDDHRDSNNRGGGGDKGRSRTTRNRAKRSKA